MIYDYISFDLARTSQNEYTFQLDDNCFSDPQLGKNMTMCVKNFVVVHANGAVINPVKLALKTPYVRNVCPSQVICLDDQYPGPVLRLDVKPKNIIFTMINITPLTVSWTYATVILEIGYDPEDRDFQSAYTKKIKD